MSTEISRLYSFADDKINGIPITASRIDAEYNQNITALNQKVIIKATSPASPINGMLWLDSTNKLLKQYRNSEWVVMGIVHVSATQPTTSQTGDIWIDTGTNLVKLYTGAAYVTVGFNPATPPAIGGTTPAAGTFTALEATVTLKLGTTNQGDILYDNGTSLVRLVPSTSGMVLKTQGAGANPAWANALASVSDYGTSTTTATARQATALKIAYGQYSFASNGSQAITGLPFSSTSSYQVVIGERYGVTTTENIRVTKDSASQFTLANDVARACTVNWIAIGT